MLRALILLSLFATVFSQNTCMATLKNWERAGALTDAINTASASSSDECAERCKNNVNCATAAFKTATRSCVQYGASWGMGSNRGTDVLLVKYGLLNRGCSQSAFQVLIESWATIALPNHPQKKKIKFTYYPSVLASLHFTPI